MAYPEEVVAAVADPLIGIAGKQTFLPSVAELKAELDRRMAPIWAAQVRDRFARERLQRREERMTPEQRARALAHWEQQKAEVRGNICKTRAEEVAAAERHLSELYRAVQMPVAISDGLRTKLSVMFGAPSEEVPPTM
jgi:hypothetical protein